jgi:hypothetical protein
MEEKIKEKKEGSFKHCIYAGKNQLANADGKEDSIKIWKNSKDNRYSNIKEIKL